MTEMSFHPAAGEFPLRDEGRLRELAEDIKANAHKHAEVIMAEARLDAVA